MVRTIQFYSLMGFDFSDVDTKSDHVEPKTSPGSARLMIDSASLLKGVLQYDPKPGNHSSFAVRCATPQEVDAIIDKIQAEGFTVVKEPWDAFWNQRYAVVEDPDGYKVDIYVDLE